MKTNKSFTEQDFKIALLLILIVIYFSYDTKRKLLAVSKILIGIVREFDQVRIQ